MAKFVVPLYFSLLQFQYQENISIITKRKEYRQILTNKGLYMVWA